MGMEGSGVRDTQNKTMGMKSRSGFEFSGSCECGTCPGKCRGLAASVIWRRPAPAARMFLITNSPAADKKKKVLFSILGRDLVWVFALYGGRGTKGSPRSFHFQKSKFSKGNAKEMCILVLRSKSEPPAMAGLSQGVPVGKLLSEPTARPGSLSHPFPFPRARRTASASSPLCSPPGCAKGKPSVAGSWFYSKNH